MERTPATDAFFAELRSARGLARGDYVVVTFCDGGEVGDALIAFVESGIKRATTSRLHDHDVGDDRTPTVFERFEIVWPPAIATRR